MLDNSSRSFLKNTPRPLLVFYVLVIYVFLQFMWWSYLLFDLNQQIFTLRNELATLKNQGFDVAESLLQEKLTQKRLMIFGEGMVFILFLSLGILQIRKSFKRESEVARQQKNFLMSVTHELKSPVAAVKLFLQTLGKHELDRNRQKEIIHRAVDETNRLDHLIGNILMASQLENHAFSIRKEALNLSELCSQFAAGFNARFNNEVLKTELLPDIWVQADQEAIRSILLNLSENAVKYGPENSFIQLCLSADKDCAVIQVKDQGAGISQEDKKRIFEKFFRAGNEETRRTKGTGLGLYIVRILTELHQGQIRVMNNQPEGTIFELRLKLNQYA
jgi:signal transduction histidine kinase